MKGLILNNLYSMGKSMKSAIFFSVVAVIVLTLIENKLATRVAGFLPVVLIPTFALEVLKYDAMSGWSKFEIILPVTRKQIVKSKYTTFLLLLLVSALLPTIMFFIADLFTWQTYTTLFFSYMLRGMGVILCIAALTYPLTYLLGTERSDSISVSSFIFAIGVFISLSLLLQLIIGKIDGFDEIFSIIFSVISILFFGISYVVSTMIYMSKEF